MDIKDSSDEEEETRDVPAPSFGKFDETIVVRNAEEIRSPPVNRRPASSKRSRRGMPASGDSANALEVDSPRDSIRDFRR